MFNFHLPPVTIFIIRDHPCAFPVNHHCFCVSLSYRANILTPSPSRCNKISLKMLQSTETLYGGQCSSSSIISVEHTKFSCKSHPPFPPPRRSMGTNNHKFGEKKRWKGRRATGNYKTTTTLLCKVYPNISFGLINDSFTTQHCNFTACLVSTRL